MGKNIHMIYIVCMKYLKLKNIGLCRIAYSVTHLKRLHMSVCYLQKGIGVTMLVIQF